MAKPASKLVALSIAGFDPSGGAGVLADLKSFAAHDLYGVAALAALAAQNTREVRCISPVDPEFLRLQLETLFDDIAVAGVKVGLLGSRENILVTGRCLAACPGVPVVVDPALRASDGVGFASPEDVAAYRECLFPVAQVLTPCADDAGRLLGMEVRTLDQMKAAAQALHEQGVRYVVVTGGHLEKPADVYCDAHGMEVFGRQRIESRGSQDAGATCTFSSAILANLIMGKAVRESVVLAKAYLSQAITRSYAIGSGQGLLNHLFRFSDTPVRAITPEVQEPAHN